MTSAWGNMESGAQKARNTRHDIRRVLSGHRFAWFGQRALDCIGLDDFLAFELVICCDDGLDADLVAQRTGAHIISLERSTGLRERWSNYSLERLFDGPTAGFSSAALSARDGVSNIVAYCSTDGLERQRDARPHELRILAAPAALKRSLDDKIALRRMLPQLGLAPVSGEIVTLGATDFAALSRSYGLPLVTQFAIGSSGHRTFFIRSEDEFRLLEHTDTGSQVSVCRYMDGPAPNIHGVVLDEVIVLSYPSVQLVGLPECTSWPAGYCGNDYEATRKLHPTTLGAIYDQARVLGTWLQQVGFRGLFGIDFVTHGTAVFPVDINPRFQGSTQLLTQLESAEGRVPVPLLHVLHFLPNERKALASAAAAVLQEPVPLSGAQINLHSRERQRCIVQGTLQPGIHGLENDRVVYRRNGLVLSDCRGDSEFLVTCAVPRTGTQIEPGAPLLKLQTKTAVLEDDCRRLQGRWANVCQWAYDALQMSPV